MNPSINNRSEASSPACRNTRACLSDYIDNTLSAHAVWEVEKHLTLCKECSEVSRQMQATVQLLHNVERFDTSDDFMAKLHGRLDGLEPTPAHRRGAADWARDLLERIQGGFSRQRLSGLNLGVAAAGLIALIVITQYPVTTAPKIEGRTGIAAPVPEPRHDDLQRNVALTANDPLGDVAADYLENTVNTTGTNSAGANATKTDPGTDGG